MRTGGRALIETTFSLDIRPLVRAGAIRDDVHADGKMRFGPDDDALTIAFEVSTLDRANRWIRVRCTIFNERSGNRCDIDDKISLATAPLPCGRKWWFICPPLECGRAHPTCLPGRGISGAGRPTISPTRPSIWTTASGPGGACASAAGSSAAIPMDSATLPREASGDAPARYAYLLDRLDAAEDHLDLPLTLSGPRFAYRPDRHRLRRRGSCPVLPLPTRPRPVVDAYAIGWVNERLVPPARPRQRLEPRLDPGATPKIFYF